MDWQKDGHKWTGHCVALGRALAVPVPPLPLFFALLPFGAGCAAFGVAAQSVTSARG